MNFKVLFILILICKASNQAVSWESALQTTISTATGYIPFVGPILSGIINLFWPSNSENIWDSIKDKVLDLVNKQILEAELVSRRNDINGVKERIENYLRYSFDTNIAFVSQKGAYLETVASAIVGIKNSLQGSNNHIHLVHLTITLAYLHLSVLKEREINVKRLWPNRPNVHEFTDELTREINAYKEYFNKAYGEWKQWRRSNVEIKHRLETKTCHARTGCGSARINEVRERRTSWRIRKLLTEIRDNTKNQVIWKKENNNNKDENVWGFSEEAKNFREQYLNNLDAEFNRSIMDRVRDMDKFLESKEICSPN
jgi:hypothetical protein